MGQLDFGVVAFFMSHRVLIEYQAGTARHTITHHHHDDQDFIVADTKKKSCCPPCFSRHGRQSS
jgi:hypothetical protein